MEWLLSVHTAIGAETGRFMHALRLPTVTFSHWYYLHSSEMSAQKQSSYCATHGALWSLATQDGNCPSLYSLTRCLSSYLPPFPFIFSLLFFACYHSSVLAYSPCFLLCYFSSISFVPHSVYILYSPHFFLFPSLSLSLHYVLHFFLFFFPHFLLCVSLRT